jgi:glycosyltransferase 2 family protein
VKTTLRVFALLLGLGLFGWFVSRAGPGAILNQVSGLGWMVVLVLVPYAVVYGFDTWGWKLAFGKASRSKPSYWTLFRVRWAGEAVNNVIPTAYVGGEAIKVYLLHKRGISTLDAGTSVVASKTCQVLAQVFFIGLGAFLALPRLEPGSGARLGMMAVTGGALAVVAALLWLQRYGLFFCLRSGLAKLSLRVPFLEKHGEHLGKLDEQIFQFYQRDSKRFLVCTLVFLGGWMADSLEVYLICHLLGQPLAWNEAVAIEAFISVAKALGIFVPAALGVQESGVVLLFHLFGLPGPLAVTYAILRRGREVVYALAGGALLLLEETSFKSLARQLEKQQPALE